MGTYTELVLKARVKECLPPDVENVLQILFNHVCEDIPTVPNHPFFACSRWDHIGHVNSFYHIPWTNSKYAHNRIFSRSDLKNYHKEIELFIDWLTPYLDIEDGTCIGWYWHEDQKVPTLLIPKEIIEC